MKTLQDFFVSILNWEKLTQRIIEWMPNLVAALMIMGLFYVLWRVLKLILEVIIRRTSLDATAASFISTVIKYTLMTIGLITALSKVGVNTLSILTSLGVVGLTVGFAAKDALANMISGVFIFWDRPFVIGDLVEIEGNYGKVEKITMRSTRVVTPDGRMLAVPNTTILNSTVASYTNFPHLRLDIKFTVGVNEDIGRIRSIVLQLCEEFSGLLKTPPPEISVIALNDYNIELLLSAWLDDETTHVKARDKLRELLYEALRSAEIDMPFETYSITPITVSTIKETNGTEDN